MKLEFVDKCYNDFKIFIGIGRKNNILPKIKQDIMREEVFSYSPLIYANTNEILKPIVTLYINPQLFKYNKQFQKSKLFHEFTHIFDANTKCKHMSSEAMESILSTYSEHHASQIELFCNVGFTNLGEIRQIDIDKTFIYEEYEKISVRNSYLHPFGAAVNVIDKKRFEYFFLSPSQYYSKYSFFESNAMYYMGKRDATYVLHQKFIPNIDYSKFGEFAPFLQIIRTDIINKDFNKLILDRNALWHKFTKKLKTCRKLNLPKNL